jgi:hypothetical protein
MRILCRNLIPNVRAIVLIAFPNIAVAGYNILLHVWGSPPLTQLIFALLLGAKHEHFYEIKSREIKLFLFLVSFETFAKTAHIFYHQNNFSAKFIK